MKQFFLLSSLYASVLTADTASKSGKPNTFFSSDEYLLKSAKSKQEDLWAEIVSDRIPRGWPDIFESMYMVFYPMDPVFDTKGDAMGPGMLWGSRTKLVHAVGTVGKVKFVSDPDAKAEYTGIFKGADYGIIRLSNAADPGDGGLTSGFGLKFLRDGVDSANLVAMFSVMGSPKNWNFFSKDFNFETRIPLVDDFFLKILGWKFSFATDIIQAVGLLEMGSID